MPVIATGSRLVARALRDPRVCGVLVVAAAVDAWFAAPGHVRGGLDSLGGRSAVATLDEAGVVRVTGEASMPSLGERLAELAASATPSAVLTLTDEWHSLGFWQYWHQRREIGVRFVVLSHGDRWTPSDRALARAEFVGSVTEPFVPRSSLAALSAGDVRIDEVFWWGIAHDAVALPLVVCAALSLSLNATSAASWAWGRIARRRRGSGACPVCRYDMRGLGVCPECGAEPRA